MADLNTPYKDGEIIVLPVAGNTLIEAGHMVAVNSSGYAVPAADSAGLTVIGIADEAVDNSSGAAGDLQINVRRKKVFGLENDSASPVETAGLGKDVYVKDSTTVSSSGGTNSIVAGKCLGFDQDMVLVEIQ